MKRPPAFELGSYADLENEFYRWLWGCRILRGKKGEEVEEVQDTQTPPWRSLNQEKMGAERVTVQSGC